MTNPLVSVTMGTHNRPTWLKTALDSVYAQTMQDFEIVLVRDGGCPVDVSQYDDRLKFIDRDENKGFAYSLNEALHYAQGRYIAYLGDDDRYYPHHLKTLTEAIEGTDQTILRGCSLGNRDAVVVKVAKPNQDARFDVPAIGLETVKTCMDGGAKVLAIEAGKTFFFQQEAAIELANKHGIAITAF